MKTTIKKSFRLDAEIVSLIDAYRENSKSSFSEAIENLIIKGLENSQAISNLKQIIKDEMKSVKEEVKNQGNRLAGININHFKFSGRIFAHTFSTFKGASNSNNEEIKDLENQGIARALQDLKLKNNDGEI